MSLTKDIAIVRVDPSRWVGGPPPGTSRRHLAHAAHALTPVVLRRYGGGVMTMEVFKVFGFEAAHYLPNLPDDHKCRRMHGHSFRVEVYVAGPVGEETGWVMDFADIKVHFKKLEERLDHRLLNEIEGLENPTSENLARWIWRRLKPGLPGLSKLVVRETCTTGCVYRGEAGG